MSEIKPFSALVYNTDKVKDLAKVMCPPYDVISKDKQNDLHSRSPNNFIWLDLGKDRPGDNNENNKYTRAKKLFDEWLAQGILIQDDKPCLYFYRQEYRVMGERHSRMGFISLMRIPEEKDAKIFPHENTHAAAKEDRLKLSLALSAQLSSIFVCFSDKKQTVEKLFSKHIILQKPCVDIEDDDGVKHILWRLDSADLIQQVVDTLDGQPLFIADGHHRYEVAQELRRIRMARSGKNKEAPYNYVMTYFTNMDSRDLKIFPMHRIVRKLPKALDFLEEHFRVDKIKSKDDLVVILAKAGQNEHAFGLCKKDEILLLRLKNKLLIDQIVSAGSYAYKRLDASILKYFIFDRLGLLSEDIIYTKDHYEVMDMVADGRADSGFVMNPVRIDQLREIALNGERMPPKTTYFYPKVLSGLTVYKMA